MLSSYLLRPLRIGTSHKANHNGVKFFLTLLKSSKIPLEICNTNMDENHTMTCVKIRIASAI